VEDGAGLDKATSVEETSGVASIDMAPIGNLIFQITNGLLRRAMLVFRPAHD
jgi:hypothetical protein